MSTTNGTMKSFKVTDKDGNVYVMTPVDTEARQAIDEAKNLQFDDDYFTSEVSQDQKTVNVGLNGVPIGVDSDSPLKFVQDNAQGIVFGSDASFSTAIAPEYSASSTYKVGSLCTHLGKLYECTTVINTAEAWNSSHWTETNVISTGNVAIFTYSGTSYPDGNLIMSEINKNKEVILYKYNAGGGGAVGSYYQLTTHVSSSSTPMGPGIVMYFSSISNSSQYNIVAYKDTSATDPTWVWSSSSDSIPKASAISPEYSSHSIYPTVGTAVMFNGKRYVNNVVINVAENWNPGHWTEKSVEDEIGNVEALLATL